MGSGRPIEAGSDIVLGVDGGNSKTDLLLARADGTLLAAIRGGTISHQQVRVEEAMLRLRRLAEAAWGRIGSSLRAAHIGVFCLAGIDFRHDERLVRHALATLGLASEVVILNDAFAAFRAGSERSWGVVIICGSGVNCAGISPDGRTARLPAIGPLSGDWGGGQAVGMAGLAAAVRARDGRGARTELERLVPAHFGLRRPVAVTERMYTGAIDQRRIGELSPVVFAASRDGDPVARRIVVDLADELARMALAIIRRLRMSRLDVEVVLGGGVFRTDDKGFFDRLTSKIRAGAPHARVRPLNSAPVLGAALIAIDRLGETSAVAADRLRRELTSQGLAS